MKIWPVACLLIVLTCFVSCADDDNPYTVTSRLISIKVMNSQGQPAGPLRVGSINHLKPISPAFRPCPETEIEFNLPEGGDYVLVISDYNGRAIREYSGNASGGTVSVTWDGLDDDGNPIPSGFYRYVVTAGDFVDEQWMVLEKGPDPQQTILGSLDGSGQFITDNIALFPGLINPQPLEVYTDTVTLHFSNAAYPEDFFYYTTELNPVANSYIFLLDSMGLPGTLIVEKAGQ